MDKLENAIHDVIILIGENPKREGLVETPKRMAKMYREVFSGLNENPYSVLEKTFTCKSNELIIVKDINFYSMCEHHFLPIIGKVDIGYIPDGKVLGLSKFARLVDIFAKRPQIQENFTNQIAETLYKGLGAKGVIVFCEAEHLCMSMRGVKKQKSTTSTICKMGEIDKGDFFKLKGS